MSLMQGDVSRISLHPLLLGLKSSLFWQGMRFSENTELVT